jgi:protein tyrosine/serine phosphatase
MTDYQRPPESAMQEVLEAFDELPKPVLIHCSAAIDRTTPVAAFIYRYRGEQPG